MMETDSLDRGGSQASLSYIRVEGQCLFPAYHHSHLDTPVWVAPLRPVLPIPRRSRRQVRSRRIGGADAPMEVDDGTVPPVTNGPATRSPGGQVPRRLHTRRHPALQQAWPALPTPRPLLPTITLPSPQLRVEI
jgi:hypothetical protein